MLCIMLYGWSGFVHGEKFLVESCIGQACFSWGYLTHVANNVNTFHASVTFKDLRIQGFNCCLLLAVQHACPCTLKRPGNGTASCGISVPA